MSDEAAEKVERGFLMDSRGLLYVLLCVVAILAIIWFAVQVV